MPKNYLDDFRIIGGSKTTIEQHPWDVSIQVSGTHTCGGSVIDTDVILTAAHCITESKVKKGLYTVVAGITDLRDEAPYTGNVARVIVHDKYNPKTYDSDIAIIKVKYLNYSDTDNNDNKQRTKKDIFPV
ncbi:hypothetical protein NQ317_004302 [Molorchus minor]|uniref:Peptidase S1 domain-containing protein n=1 Tax=Molorchus minor TaxID=1323400 RepID=A0ABQ9JEV1_9CUCU|nr:hypothetical protein NQ317_004302 [Molorchus minor]